MKSKGTLKSMSIFLLIFCAFFQFILIISNNYIDLNNMLNGNQVTGNDKKSSVVPYDYISVESIRISDSEGNFWDLHHKSDEYLQIQLAGKEVIKHGYTSSIERISTTDWEQYLSGRHIMVQYFTSIPLSFISEYTGNPEDLNRFKKIKKLMIVPEESKPEILVFDGGNYYKLLYDSSEDQIMNFIDYESIFNFVRYTNFYDKNTYKLLNNHPLGYYADGRGDIKLYDNKIQKNFLVISTIPQSFQIIETAKNTYQLNELKKEFLGVMKDRYTLSIGSNNVVYMSNLENQYTFTSNGKITYDYFGKKSYAIRGDIGDAYTAAVSMLKRFKNLMDHKSEATFVLTEIDQTNTGHYTFYFDYLLDTGKPVMIRPNEDAHVIHAFSIEANEDNVIRATGYLRNMFINEDYTEHMGNDTEKLIRDNADIFSGDYINDIYNGYILTDLKGNNNLLPALLFECKYKLLSIQLPHTQVNNDDVEDIYELE